MLLATLGWCLDVSCLWRSININWASFILFPPMYQGTRAGHRLAVCSADNKGSLDRPRLSALTVSALHRRALTSAPTGTQMWETIIFVLINQYYLNQSSSVYKEPPDFLLEVKTRGWCWRIKSEALNNLQLSLSRVIVTVVTLPHSTGGVMV